MTNNPLVSVVIPNYYHVSFHGEYIQSVKSNLSQF